jgi:hypothetical protein
MPRVPAKEWKTVQALAIVCLYLSLLWCCATWNRFPGNHVGLNSAMIAAGSCVVLIFGMIGAWWFDH